MPVSDWMRALERRPRGALQYLFLSSSMCRPALDRLNHSGGSRYIIAEGSPKWDLRQALFKRLNVLSTAGIFSPLLPCAKRNWRALHIVTGARLPLHIFSRDVSRAASTSWMRVAAMGGR